MRKVPDPAEVKHLKEKPAKPYAALKREAEAKVVRWEWATDEMCSPQPWYFEIHGFSKGKRLATAPRKKEGLVEYGFDAADRLAVIRQYTEFKGYVQESFFIGDDDQVIEYRFDDSPAMKEKPVAVTRYRHENGRLVDCAGVAAQGSRALAYDYEGPRLVSIREVTRPPIYKASYRLRYSPSGSLEAISDGAGRVVYKRLLPKLPDLLKQTHDALVHEVPAVVVRFKADEPAYCLALVYDGESTDGLLPPTVALGLESDLRDAQSSQGKKARRSPWDAQQFRAFDRPELVLPDRLLAPAADIAQHLARSGSIEPARKVLIEVSRALNRLDWAKIIPVTRNFVVYPVDLEVGHLKANMKAAVPPKTLKALQAEGLL
jgi:hypothetical protein